MARFKMVNGVKVNLTSEEETIRDQEEAQAAIDKQAEIDAATNKINLKASAKAKLIAGEPLTQEEVDTIVL